RPLCRFGYHKAAPRPFVRPFRARATLTTANATECPKWSCKDRPRRATDHRTPAARRRAPNGTDAPPTATGLRYDGGRDNWRADLNAILLRERVHRSMRR